MLNRGPGDNARSPIEHHYQSESPPMRIDLNELRALNPDLDARNLELLQRRAEAFAAETEPLVGDCVQFPNEAKLRRFTHDWGAAIQTTCGPGHPCYGDRSFYLGVGYAEFSGTLDPPIPKAKLIATDATAPAGFWFFRDDHVRAHNGVQVQMPVRVFKYQP